MIVIRSQSQGLLVKCSGMYIEEINVPIHGASHAIKGFTLSIKDSIILGQYYSQDDAEYVLDLIQEAIKAEKPTYCMPTREFASHGE